MFYKTLIPFLIAILLGTEGIFTGYSIAGIPYVRLLEIIIFIFIAKYFLQDIKKNKLLRYYMKFILLLLLLTVVKFEVFVFSKNEEVAFIFADIQYLFLYGIIIYLGYYMMKYRFNYINIILFIMFIIFLIAFFQSDFTPFTELSRNLKMAYFSQNTFLDRSENSLFSRLAGLYSFVMVLDYALLSASIVTLYMYIKNSANIYLYFFIFMGIVIFLTLTRSTIISWVIMFLFLIWRIQSSAKIPTKIIISILILTGVVFFFDFYNQHMEHFMRVSDIGEESAAGRIPLLITGAYALLLHPLGISDNEYWNIKMEMFHFFNNQVILNFPSHNALIDLGLKYTIIGLISFIVFVYIFLKKYLKGIGTKYHGYIKISMLAYLANGIVHNTFIFNLDFPILIFLSILAYEYDKEESLRVNTHEKELGKE